MIQDERGLAATDRAVGCTQRRARRSLAHVGARHRPWATGARRASSTKTGKPRSVSAKHASVPRMLSPNRMRMWTMISSFFLRKRRSASSLNFRSQLSTTSSKARRVCGHREAPSRSRSARTGTRTCHCPGRKASRGMPSGLAPVSDSEQGPDTGRGLEAGRRSCIACGSPPAATVEPLNPQCPRPARSRHRTRWSSSQASRTTRKTPRPSPSAPPSDGQCDLSDVRHSAVSLRRTKMKMSSPPTARAEEPQHGPTGRRLSSHPTHFRRVEPSRLLTMT